MAESTPSVDMIFQSMDDAWNFWKQYGQKMGFSVRKMAVRKSKKDNVDIFRIFSCSKEGKREIDKRRDVMQPHWETRCGCPARMECMLIRENMTVVVKHFVGDHNHELEPPETRHMLRSQREVSNLQGHVIEMAQNAGLRPCDTHELMVMEAGGRGNVGYMPEDQKSYLRVRRQRSMQCGEAGAILTYFRDKEMKNRQFYHDFQLDTDDLITNIFWADPEMVADYATFGDVVTFDTTYGTNKGLRPFGVFTGFSHHRQMVVFGAALLYDETAESFMWLFETFLKCHGGRAPITIFTDQDAAMAKAISFVMPHTFHGLCTWHILQNATKHLASYPELFHEFTRCMHGIIHPADFELAWATMVSNEKASRALLWLEGMYSIRFKWASCYMKNVFTLGIQSTQLSESLNSDLKSHLKCDLNMRDFFHHFDRVVDKKRHKELMADFACRQKIPHLVMNHCPFMLHASKIYTPTMFKMVQKELLEVPGWRIISRVDPMHVMVYHTNSRNEVVVMFDELSMNVDCSCKRFQSVGILCVHAFVVFNVHGLTAIPDHYIMRRWTRNAKRCIESIVTTETQSNEDDSRSWSARLADNFMRNCIRMESTSSGREKMEEIVVGVNNVVDEFCNLNIEEGTSKEALPVENIPEEIMDGSIKGMKKRVGRHATRRPKSCLEKIKHKKRELCSSSSQLHVASPIEQLQTQQYQPPMTYTQLLVGQQLHTPLCGPAHAEGDRRRQH